MVTEGDGLGRGAAGLPAALQLGAVSSVIEFFMEREYSGTQDLPATTATTHKTEFYPQYLYVVTPQIHNDSRSLIA